MNCKNCGARLKDNAKVCPNCGAFCADDEGYVLLTADDRMDDIYTHTPKKKSGALRWVLCTLLTLAIVGCGSYYYFAVLHAPQEAPPVTFTQGSGIINGDEAVIYVAMNDDAKIEYIHGVSLYAYDKTDKKATGEAVSTAYEYTKNIDDTFRVIYFDTAPLELEEGKEYTYTFEMRFSFLESDEVFTYLQPVHFSSAITEDASDSVFDHSLENAPEEATTAVSESEETTTAKATESTTAITTTAKAADVSFIYQGYWYTAPYQEGDEYTVFSLRFHKNGTYTSTRYYKKGNAAWVTEVYEGKMTVDDGTLTLDNGEGTESSVYLLDANAKTITEETPDGTGAALTARKYNSTKNAEDFFGL